MAKSCIFYECRQLSLKRKLKNVTKKAKDSKGKEDLEKEEQARQKTKKNFYCKNTKFLINR